MADGPYTVTIPEVAGQEGVLVYPNPADGDFYIRLNNTEPVEKVKIVVSDISGRTIFRENYLVQNDNPLIRMSLSGANPGLYIISIIPASGTGMTAKLIVR
jgi:hypothetical protein